MDLQDYPGTYQAADRASLDAQKSYITLTRINLRLIITGAFLAIYSVENESWKILLRSFSGISLVFSFIMTIILKNKKYEDLWYQGRALAESVKTLTWRYITCSELFEQKLSGKEAGKIFKERLDQLKNEFKSLIASMDTNLLCLPLISEEMEKIRLLSTEDRKAYYVKYRINSQKNWYSTKAQYNKKKHNLWFWVILASQASAIICVGILLIFPDTHLNLVALFTTISSASISWLQLKRHQELRQAYTTAAQELHFIESDSVDIKTEMELSKFVLDSENAISREHTLWLAQKRS
jgi:hypothetical protein